MKLLSLLKKSKIGSSIQYQIKPRKVKFEWQETPVDWIPNHPFTSYFINEINMILPAGEFWFCRLYNKVLPQITDEKLKEDVKDLKERATAQIWALIVTVIGATVAAIIKFGFLTKT